MHVREFGQTPRQLFNNLHPKKGLKYAGIPANIQSNPSDLEEEKKGETSPVAIVKSDFS